MNELIIAIGLLFVIEGLLYSIFPDQMKSMMQKMKDIPSSNLRTGGLFFALIGFIIVWSIKGWKNFLKFLLLFFFSKV